MIGTLYYPHHIEASFDLSKFGPPLHGSSSACPRTSPPSTKLSPSASWSSSSFNKWSWVATRNTFQQQAAVISFLFFFQFLHTFSSHFFFQVQDRITPSSCFVRFSPPPPNHRSFLLLTSKLFAPSLSMSMSDVGRSDGSHSLCASSLFSSSTLAANNECRTHNRSVSGGIPSMVLFRTLIFDIYLHHDPSLCHSTNTAAAAEHSSRSTSTNSGLPPIVVICIVASGSTSLSYSLEILCDLICLFVFVYFPFPSRRLPAPLRNKKSSSSLSDQSRFTSTSADLVSVRDATNTARKHGSSRT
ncbi:hypothetical protein F5888DRAFT_1100339 [Russula emetica]|nr:hypothetical protein F5888DRAFT_1100339 [Russula emetica]